MKRLLSVPITLAGLFLLLMALNSVNAVSIGASFTAMNGTLKINQNLFFNISATFPENITYNIYLNNVSVKTGFIPANDQHYETAKYNITNSLAGDYNSSIKFSTLFSRINSNTTTLILPHPAFDFPTYSNRTFIVNDSAVLSLEVLDSGNTPLNFDWALPVVTGVYFNITHYTQLFSLAPGQAFKMPMNITLKSGFSPLLNFSFIAGYNNYTMRDNYITTLFAPVINLSFSANNVITGKGNASLYSVDIKNGDNLAVNVTFQFIVNIDGNDFYYTKSYIVEPNTTKAQINIPNSQLLQVNVFYLGQNDKPVDEQIFYQPQPNPNALSGFLADAGYIAILGGAMALLVYLHYRLSKNKGP